jgi:hypothetical protein
MSKVRKTIVLSDMQVPFHSKKALSIVEQYMADERWDEYVNIGDFLDLEMFSSFTKDAPRKVETRRVKSDFEMANEILDRHQEIIRKNNPKANYTLLLGNHEARCERFVDAHPTLEGFLDIEKDLRLKERGFKCVRCYPNGEAHSVGKLKLIHGIYVGPNAARKTIENFGESVMTGHTHSMTVASKSRWGDNNALQGFTIGCLCDMRQDYVGRNPTEWALGFAVIYTLENGDFFVYTPKITNWRMVAPNGKVYEAKRR